jgi:nitrite reductase/ring-hydroxylating ferredoxin subunit
MARRERLIGSSADAEEGAQGLRFGLDEHAGGFAVRFGGTLRAYVNRCPHLGTELDWQPGDFFEESGLYLVCSTHGAIFEPDTGKCVAGPCRGASLEPLQVREREGQVFLEEEEPGPAIDDEAKSR